MGFEPGVSGNPRGRPRGSRNKATRAVAEWTAAILEDPKVQARLLSDARQGRLHHAVLSQLLLNAYGRPATSPQSESMIPLSALAEANDNIHTIGLRRLVKAIEYIALASDERRDTVLLEKFPQRRICGIIGRGNDDSIRRPRRSHPQQDVPDEWLAANVHQHFSR